MLRVLALSRSAPAAAAAARFASNAASAAACNVGGCSTTNGRSHFMPRRGEASCRCRCGPSRGGHGTATSTTTTNNWVRRKSTSAAAYAEYHSEGGEEDSTSASGNIYNPPEIRRLSHLRNVGILAHVDAGKTTVTERMLALTGVVRRAGSVDTGSTVTDYLPAERERGITIQSAAISFEWGWHNARTGDDMDANDSVTVHLIDTPGHVDFTVEVNRSVAVLDGAVLVVDAVAGVQAQTETVWRAMNAGESGTNNNGGSDRCQKGHEPLPCLALVNKMDKEGCNFGHALRSLRDKLPGANPVAIQIPLFRVGSNGNSAFSSSAAVDEQQQEDRGDFGIEDDDTDDWDAPPSLLPPNIVAVPIDDLSSAAAQDGEFVGIVDLVHMRAVIWPDLPPSSSAVNNVEECVPTVTNLIHGETQGLEVIDPECEVTRIAMAARADLVGCLADVDESMEEYYLLEEEPNNAEVRAALRRATLSRKAMPVMAGAALRGRGVEPLLDAVADLLPSPLDRRAPGLMRHDDRAAGGKRRRKNGKRQDDANEVQAQEDNGDDEASPSSSPLRKVTLGHPLHPKTLALAFKVVHMKGRGGSGDGRVVFARVYSGKIRARDTLRIVTPPSAPGAVPDPPRTERVGGLLELAGGRFDNLEDGTCLSGDVCALVGLKSVMTGDTILLASEFDGKKSNGGNNKKSRGKKRNNGNNGIEDEDVGNVCLAGVASPKPVLTVRVEAESAEQQSRLSDALSLLAIEDPSLTVEESNAATLISGLGELHIEIVLDRLRREFGLEVTTGSPAVAYRETVAGGTAMETGGLVEYDRTIGGTRLQAAVHLMIEPMDSVISSAEASSCCMPLSDPVVTMGPAAREFLDADEDMPEEDLMHRSDLVKALVSGCLGSLRRGAIGPYAMANVRCRVVDVDAEGGLPALSAMPGSLRAAAANAVSTLLSDGRDDGCLTVLEPAMSVEVTVPGDMVGTVLSDLTGRRGTVGDVVMGGEDENGDGDNGRRQRQQQAAPGHAKALVRAEVPLVEILGYANSLRSLTGGEGAFTAEYKGHSPCDEE